MNIPVRAINLRKVLFLLLASCLVACSGTNEKPEPKIDIGDAVVEPIILLAAATCVYYFEKGEWPNIQETPTSQSVFDNYYIRGSAPEFHDIQFKIRSFNYYWDMKFTTEENSDFTMCHAELTGGQYGGNKPIKLPFQFASNQSYKLEDIKKQGLEEAKDVIGFYIGFICTFDRCMDNESELNKKRDWIGVVGTTLTAVGLYALLGLAHGGYDY